MWAEYLKRWMAAARKAEKDDTTAGEETTEGKESMESTDSAESTESTEPTEAANWERVVDLVKTVFMEVRLAEDAMCQAVVLIPKGENDHRGIVLVEMM